MTRPGLLATLLGLVVHLAAFASPAPAQAPGREAVTVEVSAAATRRLAEALELFELQQWEDGLNLLDELDGRLQGALLEVEPRRYLEASWCARLLRSQLPASVLRSRRDQRDARFQERLQEAAAMQDRQGLWDLIQREPSSSLAPDAARALASLGWQTGRLDEAVVAWSLLSPPGGVIDAAAPFAIPSDSANLADLAARRILASDFGGDRLRAREQLRDFRLVHPDATGQLAGEEGLWIELLQQALASPPMAHRPVDDDAARTPLRDPIEPGLPLWRTPLDRFDAAAEQTSTPMLRASRVARSVPVVSRDRVFIQEADRLRALRGSDGTPLWPTGAADDDGTFYQINPPPQLASPWRGDFRWAPEVSAGRLFAVMGHPISMAASLEPRPLEQRLVCCDVGRQEGKLLWSRTPRQAFPEAGWRFAGPPRAHEGAVYVVGRSAHPEMQIGVVCLDAATGESKWFSPVCGLLAQASRGTHVATADRVEIGLGRLFLSGDFGATACLDATSGTLQWISLDARLARGAPEVDEPSAAARSAVYTGGMVYSVQHDDRTVQALDPFSGAIRWRTSLPSGIHELLGVRAGVLAASGESLWGLDIDTGGVRWRFGFDEPGEGAAGAGIIAGRSVHWPLRTELIEVDLLTGAPTRRVPLAAGYGLAGGHLLATPEALLIASSGSLAALARQKSHEDSPQEASRPAASSDF